MLLHHFNRSYLSDNHLLQSIKTIGEPSTAHIDDIDIRILAQLAKDARSQITGLCGLVGLTAKAVILRIRKLEKKGVILGYKPKLNLDKIGYSMYKVDLKVVHPEAIKPIQHFVFSSPHIIHAQTVIGGTDVEFDVEVPSFEKFSSLITGLKDKFGDSIESITYFRTIKIYKTLYLPV